MFSFNFRNLLDVTPVKGVCSVGHHDRLVNVPGVVVSRQWGWFMERKQCHCKPGNIKIKKITTALNKKLNDIISPQT